MSLMQQLIADVRKHEHSLEEREAELKDELAKTRKMHREVVRHRERLERDHGNGEAALPLGEPEDEEEEATDEAEDAADLADARQAMAEIAEAGATPWGHAKEQLAAADEMAQQWEPADAETRARIENEAEAAKDMRRGLRRRKAKAAAEE